MSSAKTNNIVQLKETDTDVLQLQLNGRVDRHAVKVIWRKVGHVLKHRQFTRITVDAVRVDYLDSIGAGLLVWLKNYQLRSDAEFVVEGLENEFAEMLESYGAMPPATRDNKPHFTRNFFANIGTASLGVIHDLRQQVAFAGELSVAAAGVFVRPRKIRWKDVLLTAESAGADAFGIIALVGFLLGLILAYQSVHSLKDFGAEIYVADIVSLSLFRELGPLMTAIILAGRSGSAFAAEIGTMKVNEEIDALTTMGLDPVRFLALPRIIAAVVVTPLLSLFACLFGLVGAGLVMLLRGFPLATYYNQVRDAVDLGDLSGGLAKAFVFGVLIASIGCLRGLQTALGARSVGVSATRAVVSGIVLIVVADGIFAVIFNLLEI